jgi:predicted ATPase
LPLLRAALSELRHIEYGVYYVVFLGEFAEASGRAGDVAEGLVAIDEALERAERNEERWYLPELLRIRGDLALREGTPHSADEAEKWLRQSLDLAREQKTRSWELRTTSSLCRLWVEQGRTSEAHAQLAPLLDRFEEGFGTEDLRAAKKLLSGFA